MINKKNLLKLNKNNFYHDFINKVKNDFLFIYNQIKFKCYYYLLAQAMTDLGSEDSPEGPEGSLEGPEESLEESLEVEQRIVVLKVLKVYQTLYDMLERSGTNLVPQSTDFSALGLPAEYKPAFTAVMARILKPH